MNSGSPERKGKMLKKLKQTIKMQNAGQEYVPS
jgi:hypothetical protein